MPHVPGRIGPAPGVQELLQKSRIQPQRMYVHYDLEGKPLHAFETSQLRRTETGDTLCDVCHPPKNPWFIR